MSELKALKGSFFEPEKLQNHTNVTNEGKGKEKKKERRGGKGEKLKKQGCSFSFCNGYFVTLVSLGRPKKRLCEENF